MNWQQISLFAAALALSNGSHTAESLAKPAVRAAEPQPKVGVWGVDLSGMDTSVRPGDDFYRYANGKWLAANSIPPDLSDWGTIRKLRSDSEAQVHDLVEALPPHAAPGTSEQKAHDVYHSFLDVVAIEKIGLKSASKGLEDIAGAKSYGDVARLLGRPDLGLESPIRLRVAVDRRNPDRYIVVIGQSGLSLPDRDYYLKDAPVFAEIRKNFVAHLERMLSLGGAADAAAEARAIFDLETQIATRHWPVEKRREREITYNPRTRDQLGEVSEQFPWSEILAAGGLQEQREFVVAELDAVQALGDFFVTVPLETWRSYLKYHYLIRYANVLPNAFDAENFDFYGRVLNGREQQRERWTRAVNEAQGAVGEIFGKMYVRKYFSADAKRQVLELVENLRRAYARRIQNAAWLSAATKKAALEKLAGFRPKIGYPDRWKDYSQLEIRPGDAFGNAVRARVFDWEFDRRRLGQKTDRDEWSMTPQTVNAYYNATFNEVVFPAAILQPPIFDPNADSAVNYGAVGSIIGHEMGHGFDDQGAKSDGKGVLRNWWQTADEESFRKLVAVIVKQYGDYEALPGQKLNGKLTAGENIGDLGGVGVAYEAYLVSLNGKPAPVLDGFTGTQRFFLGKAQTERRVIRDAALRSQVMSDPHSPSPFRVNGVVRNIDSWYEAFDVKPDNKLYLSPEQRLKIW